jgi:hypothetical protein
MTKEHWEKIIDDLEKIDYSKEEYVRLNLHLPESLHRILIEDLRNLEDYGIKSNKTEYMIVLLMRALAASHYIEEDGSYFTRSRNSSEKTVVRLLDVLEENKTKAKKKKRKRK